MPVLMMRRDGRTVSRSSQPSEPSPRSMRLKIGLIRLTTARASKKIISATNKSGKAPMMPLPRCSTTRHK